MSIAEVLLPVFVLVALPFILLFWMGKERRGALVSREVQMRDIALDEPNWPKKATQLGNCLKNQFEFPVLFYILVALALPLRPGGALDMMARMLGDWKKPKPAPHTPMRQTMSATLGDAGSIASSAIPMPSNTSPNPPSTPAEWRSDNLPAIGAMIATTIDHGVMKNPVSTWVR